MSSEGSGETELPMQWPMRLVTTSHVLALLVEIEGLHRNLKKVYISTEISLTNSFSSDSLESVKVLLLVPGL